MVVAGMHRSGTSAVARLLSLLGFGLPRTPVGPRPSNELGHWGESEVLRSINDELLSAVGSAWDDVAPLPPSWLDSPAAEEFRKRIVDALESEYPDPGPFVLKDPRICRLVPFWLRALDEFGARAAFVLPIRNPLEVAASLGARNGFSDSKGLLLWLRHVLDAERDTRRRPRAFVAYDDLLRDRRRAAETVAVAIDLPPPGGRLPASDDLEHFLPASQRHHHVDLEQLRASEEVVAWVKESYDLLMAAAGSESSPDPSRLDEISVALAEADLAYGPVLAEAELRAQDLSDHIESERARFGSEVEALEGRLDDRRREAHAARAEAAALRHESRELRATIVELQNPRRRALRRLWHARDRMIRGRRRLSQLGSWVLGRSAHAGPRTVWEFLVLRASGEFDPEYYLRHNPDVAAAGMSPLMHYLEHGARAGLDPSASFSTSAYLAERPGLSDSGVNPLYHYWRNGLARKGRASGLPGQLRLLVSRRANGSGPAQGGGGPMAGTKRSTRASVLTTMFGDYLAYAMVDPQIDAPFEEADRRVLGAMDSHRRQLVKDYAALPADRLVSVITPTHNRLRTLKAAIDSVQAQRHHNWELIVVDDGSEDGTSDYVEGLDDDRIHLITLPENRGVAAARNAGLEAARGQLIAYLDSDNTWHPDYLLVMAGFLGDRPQADIAYCAQEIWRTSAGAGGAVRELEAVRFGPFNRALLENRNYIDLNAVMHTARILKRSGGFDEALPRLVDWEQLLRYTLETPALAVPCVLSRYEHGAVPGQLTGARDWWDVLDRLLEIVQAPPLDIRVPAAETRAAAWGVRPLHRPVTHTGYRRPIAIVIPSFEAVDYLRACVESVLTFTDGDFRVIVVDNGSSEGVQAYLRSLAPDAGVDVIQNGANLGFSEAVNRGIEAAGDRDIVLLNNDALATPGWVPGMWEVFDHIDDVGLVVPRQTLFPGTPTTDVHVPYSRADREVDVSLSAHHANVLDPMLDPARGYVELRFGTFFCAYIPSETVEAVGLLNVEHGPHYRSDRLYCDMVREFAKRRIVYTPHSKLYHFLQRSTRDLQSAQPAAFEDMFVRNDWEAVTVTTQANRAPARPDADTYGER